LPIEIKLKGPKGKRKRTRELKSRVNETREHRIVKERGPQKEDTSVFIIDGGPKGIHHLHCKRCNNKWWDSDAELITKKFDIKPTQSGALHISCGKCGREGMSG